MKKLWPPLLLWLALWLGGSVYCAWSLQGTIQTAARRVLAGTADRLNPGTTVDVVARGRSLELSGMAFRQSDIDLLTKHLRDNVKLSTRTLSRIELQPKPPGWGILVASSSLVRLFGVAGSEFESQRISTGLASAASSRFNYDNHLVVDGSVCESDQLDVTLGEKGGLPALNERVLEKGLLAAARWGGAWTELDLAKPMETLRKQLVAVGMQEDAWHNGISVDVEKLRDFQAAWLNAQREQRARANLPSGHVVLALRADAILLRGEMGDETSRMLLVDGVTKAAGPRRVIDEVMRSSHRRPETDVRALVNKLPELPTGLLAKLIAIGSPSSGWHELNLKALDVLDEEGVAAQIRPSGIDPKLVMPDMLTAITWLHSVDDAPIRMDTTKRLPHLLLVSAGSRLMLRGAVADEATRSQVELAARRLYTTRTVDCSIRLDSDCAPMNGILHTTTSLPNLPAINTTGFIAIAVPGEEWRGKIMRSDFLDEAGLDKSGILPEGITARQVMPDVLDVADIVKAHLHTVAAAPRGIPLQAP